jgi:hypothetical protein
MLNHSLTHSAFCLLHSQIKVNPSSLPPSLPDPPSLHPSLPPSINPDDGLFWMSKEDAFRHFWNFTVCKVENGRSGTCARPALVLKLLLICLYAAFCWRDGAADKSGDWIVCKINLFLCEYLSAVAYIVGHTDARVLLTKQETRDEHCFRGQTCASHVKGFRFVPA